MVHMFNAAMLLTYTTSRPTALTTFLLTHRLGKTFIMLIARKPLRLPRCLRRGGMSVRAGGSMPPALKSLGVQWRHGPATHTPCRLRYALPLGLVAQVSTRRVARCGAAAGT